MSLRPRAARWSRWGRRVLWTSGVVGGAALVFDTATDNSLSRSCRTVWAFSRIAYAYKYTTPATQEEYFSLHQAAADSILHVCLANEGLYVKLGQGLHSMSHVLPKQYTDTLAVLLDSAKPVDMRDVRRIIEAETGRPLEDVFERFEETPVASASIAQVHRAWLRVPSPHTAPGSSDEHAVVSSSGSGSGTAESCAVPVAVKVRKPCIGRQSKWDIYTYQLLSFAVEQLFGLPTKWSRKTIVDGLKREMDFRVEADNAEQVRQHFAGDSRVYVPTIYRELSSTQLLVMEWVDAVKLLDVPAVRAEFDANRVLTTLFDAFGDMVFKHGFVHCDPHAANVLVRHRAAPAGGQAARRAVKGRRDIQIVLLDFGLCVPESERFRMQYALLFKSLATHDMDSVRKVVADWGISDAEVFASIQLQKPLRSIREGQYDEVTKEEVREMQRNAHTRMKTLMLDEQKIPQELPLVGRGVDILRGINRLYGSPINRINMFITSAVDALGPLHDYEGVERYLQRLHVIVAQAQARDSKDGSGVLAGPSTAADASLSASSISPIPIAHGRALLAVNRSANAVVTTHARTHDSVYDDGARQLRAEQAAAVKEIALARDSSLRARVLDRVESIYRLLLFKFVLLSLGAQHGITRWYNGLVNRVASKDAAAKLRARTLDDRLEQMENAMHVE